jgi:hypothetical protein
MNRRRIGPGTRLCNTCSKQRNSANCDSQSRDNPLAVQVPADIFSTVRLSLFLLPIVAFALFTRCESISHPWPKNYRSVRLTNPRGELITEWTAVGHVARTEDNGYRFRAVQRISAPPYPEEIHYPEGRIVEINGPTIIVHRCGKPLWLYEYEGY